jgi:hypothetical protein
MDGMDHDLGVGLGGEDVSGGQLFASQLLVVFDDAVVHQHAAIVTDVGMGIVGRRLAVGRPARVGDAERTREWIGRNRLGQTRDLAEFAPPIEPARVIEHGQARRVISAIFEPTQPLQQDGRNRALSDGTDDSAHR